MTRWPSVTVLGVILCAAFLPACSTTPTSPTLPTTTTTTTTSTTSIVSATETFDGVLSGGVVNYHTFHTLAGTVTTTITSIDPTAFTAPIGLGVGTWDGSSCTVVIANPGATVGSVLVGTATTELDLCVKVYDIGNLAANFVLNYQVTVVHQAKSQ